MLSIHLHEMHPVIWNIGKDDEYESDWKCGISMRPTGYDMSITSDYINIIENIQTTLKCMGEYTCVY